MKTDLHVHTTASDGLLTPTEIVNWAKNSGLKAVAITDHDSVSGIDEAINEGKKLGVYVVPGIEISTYSNCEIHILGYNIDYKNPDFCEELEKIKDMRKERNAVILSKLSALGIEVGIDATADGIGRLNIAKAMADKGYVRDVNDAFERYLGPHGKVFTEIKRTTPLEAVKMIKRYGGISSIAHPKKYLLDKRLEILVDGLKCFGLDGIETYYPRHTGQDEADLVRIANKYKLLMTGGSDYHGYEDKHFQVEIDPRTAKALKIRIE